MNLIEDNLKLVHMVAQEYKGRGIEYDDLVSTGNIGLVKAAQTYDESKGYKFSTYGAYCIRNQIKMLFRDTIGKKNDIVIKSFDEPVYGEGEKTKFEDTISDDSEFEKRFEEHEDLIKAFNVLDDREKSVIDLVFSHGKTQQQTGEILGLTQPWVGSIQRRALAKMKAFMLG